MFLRVPRIVCLNAVDTECLRVQELRQQLFDSGHWRENLAIVALSRKRSRGRMSENAHNRIFLKERVQEAHFNPGWDICRAVVSDDSVDQRIADMMLFLKFQGKMTARDIVPMRGDLPQCEIAYKTGLGSFGSKFRIDGRQPVSQEIGTSALSQYPVQSVFESTIRQAPLRKIQQKMQCTREDRPSIPKRHPHPRNNI